jgi:hypothetical protein
LEVAEGVGCISLPTTPGALSLICLTDLAGYLKPKKMVITTEQKTQAVGVKWRFDCDTSLNSLREQWEKRDTPAVQYLLRAEGGTLGALFRAANFLPSRFISHEHPSIVAHWPVSGAETKVTFTETALELEWDQYQCNRGCNSSKRFGWDNHLADTI